MNQTLSYCLKSKRFLGHAWSFLEHPPPYLRLVPLRLTVYFLFVPRPWVDGGLGVLESLEQGLTDPKRLAHGRTAGGWGSFPQTNSMSKKPKWTYKVSHALVMFLRK